MSDKKEFFMNRALQEADLAYTEGEVPVGAVLVLNDEIVATGHNSMIQSKDPSAHAEIVTIRNAGQKISNYRLLDTEMYVTLEPCLMCYSAMVNARIKKLYYAAEDFKTGVFSTGAYDSVKHVYNHEIEVEPGLGKEAASRLLSDFFKERRGAGAVERGGLENR